jgi:NAD(P)-dependent dehydrogenase (short-subunit alcohol dehydrogenase family)
VTIDGKVVVITAASSGIGLAAAALLAGETGMMPALLTRTSTFDELDAARGGGPRDRVRYRSAA